MLTFPRSYRIDCLKSYYVKGLEFMPLGRYFIHNVLIRIAPQEDPKYMSDICLGFTEKAKPFSKSC